MLGFHMPWMGSRSSPHVSARAMIGVKPADSVLVVGASDGGLAADVALVTGLNGRTVVVDSAAGSQAGVDAAAAKAGALVEFLVAPATALPLDPGGFDVVIVLAASLPELGAPSGVFDEAARVTRPAGRVLFIEHLRKPGVRALRSKPAAPRLETATVCRLFEGAGLRSARVLAEADGRRFYEAVKPRRDRT